MKKPSSAALMMGVVAALLGASTARAQTSGTSGTTSTDTTTTATDGSGFESSTTTSTTGATTTTSTSTTAPASTSPALATSTTTTAPAPSHVSTVAPPAPTTTGVAPPEEPEEEDEGDGRDVDFLWIEAMGGVSNVNLVAFGGAGSFSGASTDGSSVFDEVQGTGPMVGGALGFRVYWIAVGARATYASYNAFQIGTLGGEVALRFPIPVVEPYIRAGFGYAWQGDANYTVSSGGVSTQPATTVYGWAFNAALGIDIFLANWFTIGAGVGLDVLNMARQTDPRMSCMGVTDFCPSKPGDAVGYQLSGFGQIGFHF